MTKVHIKTAQLLRLAAIVVLGIADSALTSGRGVQ